MKFVRIGSIAALLLATACDNKPAATEESKPANEKTEAKAMAKADKMAAGKAKTKPKSADIPAPKNVAAAPADAEKSASGLASTVLTKGTGSEKPEATDTVKVHYTGWTKDGKMFDSSVKRGKPTSFPLRGVIKGWTEGLQLMVVGEKRRFWIPGELAYGNEARGGRPAGQLTFDVELLEIKKPPKPPETPKDVKAPPKGAKKTKSGLAYKVLSAGKGTRKPTATDRVRVHYSGWTTDGKMFDSSVTRGRPASFSLNGVIKGWTEGLQLMSEGEKTRFWIPGKLAYGEKAGRGRPSGMLVFDVELLEIITPMKSKPAAK